MIPNALSRPRSIRCSALLLAIAGGLVPAGGLAAAEVAPEPADDVQVFQGTAIVVQGQTQSPKLENESGTALWGATPLIETPFSVGSYDRTLIEDQRAFTLHQVLRNDAAVSANGLTGASFHMTQGYMIRGFQTDPWSTYRLDGQHYLHQNEPAMEGVERVEVLKGPSALRLGFAPPGGMINLVTKRPTEEFQAQIQVDVDSWGALYAQADAGGRFAQDAFGYRLVVAADTYDSFYDHADGDRFFASGTLDWRASDWATVWATVANHDRTRSTYSGALVSDGGLFFGGPEDNYNQPWSEVDQSNLSLSLGADFAIGQHWFLRTIVNQNTTTRGGVRNYIWDVQDNGDYDSYQWADSEQEWVSRNIEAFAEGTFTTGSIRHDLVVGGVYQFNDTTGIIPRFASDQFLGSGNVFDPRPSFDQLPYSNASWTWNETSQYAVFLTDTVHFNDQWSTLLGLRYSRYDSTYFDEDGSVSSEEDDDALTPTVALMYKPVENVHAYISFAQGLEPGVEAAGWATNAGTKTDPLLSNQYEIGVKGHILDGRWSGELALFYIERDLAFYDGTDTLIQDGHQIHKGIEFATWGNVIDPLILGLSGMFLDAEQEAGNAWLGIDGKRPANVPTYQIRIWGDWSVEQVEGLGVFFNTYAVSSRFIDSTETVEVDSYVVFSVGGRYSFNWAATTWTTRLNIENLFNEEYFVSGNAGEYTAYYGSPLAARVSVAVAF